MSRTSCFRCFVWLNISHMIHPQRNHAYIRTHYHHHATLWWCLGVPGPLLKFDLQVFRRGDELHTQTDTTWLNFSCCSKLVSFKKWIIQVIWDKNCYTFWISQLVFVGTWTFSTLYLHAFESPRISCSPFLPRRKKLVVYALRSPSQVGDDLWEFPSKLLAKITRWSFIPWISGSLRASVGLQGDVFLVAISQQGLGVDYCSESFGCSICRRCCKTNWNWKYWGYFIQYLDKLVR